MLRSLAVILAITLPAASPPPAAPGGDRVTELAGSWTCRNASGNLSTVVYRADRGGIAATETSADAGAPIANDVFTPVPSGGWTVERSEKVANFNGYGPAWTTGPWIVAEPQKHGAAIRYERIDDRTLRRTFTVAGRAYAGEVCARGAAPPDPALCALPDVPASVVKPAQPDTPLAAQLNGVSATVDVRVSLDAQGHVVDATIARSGSALVNDAAIAAARRSTYSPALRDCKPAPSTYLFRVEFNSQ